jgi:hypothetical protein
VLLQPFTAVAALDSAVLNLLTAIGAGFHRKESFSGGVIYGALADIDQAHNG